MRNQRGFGGYESIADYADQKRTVVEKTCLLFVLHIALAVTVGFLVPSEHYGLRFILILLVLLIAFWVVRIGVHEYSQIMQRQKMSEKIRLEQPPL